MNEDREELEHIPWSELMTGEEPGPRRLLYLGAGILAALAIGMLVGRTLAASGSPGPATVVADTAATTTTPPTVPAATEVPPAPVLPPAGTAAALEEPEPATTVAAATTTIASSDPPVLYSEADLRTIPEDAFVRAAVARAEWFVADYFTADAEPNGTTDVLSALPPGTELPEMPQEGDGGLSYVEWAHAFRVEAEGDGVYAVGVLYRSLAAPVGGAFYRIRVRAVEVRVAVGTDGGTRVLDMPAAVPIPDGPLGSSWPSESVSPPPEVAEQAVLAASEWGHDPLVLSATLRPDSWRVVVTAADEVGNRWPVVVAVPVD
jgi:hypothetical protein